MTRLDTLKKWSGRYCLISAVLCGSAAVVAAWPVDPIRTETRCTPERRDVDLVICLDTSGSMQGLIESARARLWDVVNSLAQARPTPRLRVGLLTYGSPSRSTASRGWIVKQCDLTSDLDTVYSRMMAMTIDGGDEFVGWVLHDAVQHMDWSNDPRALRLIFVAGNESADQASEVHNFRTVAQSARGKDITINAIFAGGRPSGVAEHWHEVASYGGGSYSAIDMQCGTIQIDTPQDKLLLELNLKLNATYIPFGQAGAEGERRQQEQDRTAKRIGPASDASRVAAKASPLYDNAHWDLVDAVADGRVKPEEIEAKELPAKMQAMPATERTVFVKKMHAERADIQRQITTAQSSREKFMKDARAKTADGKTALDEAIDKTVREQAKAKGFKFE